MHTIPFEKFTLSNGLDVILHQDHAIPVTAVNVWYHVGSKDEDPGRRGFAHLFEHLMFEGSKHHNRSHFDPLQQAGATLNGSTTTDRTNYWEDVPSNYLELALWLEADRMGFLLEALDQGRFDVQREVVKNERRQNYENRPYGMARSLLQANLFPAPHPYHWWTIGDPEDLDAASLEDVKAFFRRFYGPSNASLSVAGDFQRDEAERLVHRYFDDLPPIPPIPRINRRDSDLRSRVSLTMYDRVQLPRLFLAWPTPPHLDNTEAPLALLATILGEGKTSRLYRSLVYEKQIAQSVIAYHLPAELASDLTVDVTPAPGHTIEEVHDAIQVELERIRREPPAAPEVTRAKNTLVTHSMQQLEHLGGFGGRADLLNAFNVLTGDPQCLNTDLQRYLAVEPEDIQQVAARFLGDACVQLTVRPEPARSPSPSGVDRSKMPAPGRAPVFTPPIPQGSALANGLKILVTERPDLPLVVFGLLLRGGSATDMPDTPGLAYLTGAMLSEGTTTRTSQEIAEEFDLIGSRLSTITGRESVLLSTETLKEHWPRALELTADLLQRATFPQKEWERVQREHLTNLRRTRDDPVAIAERVMPALLYGPESPYGHPTTGVEVGVTALSREHLVRYFQGQYRPAGATLLVAGDVSLQEVVRVAERELGDWQHPSQGSSPSDHQAPLAPPKPTTIALINHSGAAQSVIRVGRVGVPRTHPDYYALNLLNYAFGGQFTARLNMNLRETKGYTYGYRSFIQWHRTSSALVAGGGVHSAVTREAVAETLREFSDIRGDRPLTPEEFTTAKTGYLRAIPGGFETSRQVVEHLLEVALFNLPGSYFSTFVIQMEALTLDDLHRAAAEHLDDQRLTVLVVGDQATVEAPLREMGLPLVLLDHEGNAV